MAWGAAATGTRAATGSTGPGTVADAGVARRDDAGASSRSWCSTWPRGQGDYFQATRGGGHGDYRHLVLAPMDVARGGRAHAAGVPPRRHVAQPGAGLRRLLPRAHLRSRSTSRRSTSGRCPPKDWALDGSLGRHRAGQARVAARRRQATRRRRLRPRRLLPARARHAPRRWSPASSRWSRSATSTTPRWSSSRSAPPAKYVRYAVGRSCAPTGMRVGYVRPITLLPFPTRRWSPAPPTARARRGLREQPGPDDRRRAARRARARPRSQFIGGLSLDGSGFGIAPDLDVDDACGARIERQCMDDIERAWNDRGSSRSIPTDAPPDDAGALVDDFTPPLIDVGEHQLCPGCGEPIAMRSVARGHRRARRSSHRAIGVFGIGCYTAFSNNLDVEVLQALHGRAPSLATGVKRAKPDTLVFTVQGDGDMVNEGLQEVIHAAARGESITCVMLNNGVFGETGGHMTATTVLGQRTKNTLDGRDAAAARLPDPAEQPHRRARRRRLRRRAARSTPPATSPRTKRMIARAFETQLAGAGFSFVEILTMCPTGWFIETAGGARLPRRHARRHPHDRRPEGHRLQITDDTGCGDHTRAVTNSWARSPDASRTVRTNRNPRPRPRAANSDVLRSRPPLVKAAINTSALTARSLRGDAVRSLSTTMMRPSCPAASATCPRIVDASRSFQSCSTLTSR